MCIGSGFLKVTFRLFAMILTLLPKVSAECTINGQKVSVGDTLDVAGFRQQCFHKSETSWENYPVGCIAANGTFLKVGQKANDINNQYQYECQQPGDKIFAYNPVACLTNDGQAVLPGSTLNVTNFGQYKCNRKGEHGISTTWLTGCVIHGIYYKPGSLYMDLDKNVEHVCAINQGKYVMKAASCIFDNVRIPVGHWDLVNKNYLSCDAILVETGGSTAKANHITETSCKKITDAYGKVFESRLNDRWTVNNVQYECAYIYNTKKPAIRIKNCFDDKNQSFGINVIKKTSDGRFCKCDIDVGFVIIDEKYSTCKLPDGTIIRLGETGNDASGVRYGCWYYGLGKYSYIFITGCWYRNMTFSADGTIVRTSQSTAAQCIKVKGQWIVYELTPEEYEKWLSTHGEHKEVDGYNGSGGSGNLTTTTESTTTSTTTTTTTTTPTTTSSTTSTTESTTTTTIPTTTSSTTTSTTTTTPTTTSSTTTTTIPTTTTETETTETTTSETTTFAITPENFTTEVTSPKTFSCTNTVANVTSTIVPITEEPTTFDWTEFTMPEHDDYFSSTTTEETNTTEFLSKTDCFDSNVTLCQKLAPVCLRISEWQHLNHTVEEWCPYRELTNSEEMAIECTGFMRATVDVIKSFCPLTCNSCKSTKGINKAAGYMVYVFTSLKKI